jgi:peptidase S41-like protein/tricorn protease-like protein
MRNRKRIRVTGAAVAALLVASAVPAAAAPAAATHGDDRLDGIWRTDGYSTIVQISGGTMKTYDTTAISCIPGLLSGTGSGKARADGTRTFTDDDGTVSTITPGWAAGHATWRIDANVNSRALTKLPALPATCSAPTPNTPPELFDIFWRTFAENYPFFALHGVDWDSVYAKYRPMVTAKTTPTQLTDILAAMIEPLHDAHVGLVTDTTTVYTLKPGTAEPSAQYDAQVLSLIERADLAGTGVQLRTWCNGKVAYADLPDGVGYLRVSNFTRFTSENTFAANKAAFDAALNDIFTAVRTSGPDRLRGLIVDLRVNGGGDDPLGIDLASRLTAAPFLAYAKRVRNDPADPGGFTAPQPIFVRPSAAPRYTGPTAILTAGSTFSAAETFTQAMLNRTPRPVVVGENTQGVFSDMLERALPNGWWFGLPDEEYLTPRGTTYDVTGVAPDIPVTTLTPQQVAEGTDPAFETALSNLERSPRTH